MSIGTLRWIAVASLAVNGLTYLGARYWGLVGDWAASLVSLATGIICVACAIAIYRASK